MGTSVVITDYGFPDVQHEEKTLGRLGYEVVAGHCVNEDEVLELSKEADAVMVQWAPITKKVIENLENCKVIVRYGIGVDNIDLEAAKERGIPVCNVPDYCISEVADHTIALALALSRQLTTTDRLVRDHSWKITPPLQLPPYRDMLFATIGYGRIAREVLRRAVVFGFHLAAYDPFIGREEMEKKGVNFLTRAQLLRQADIISLHLPLTDDTYHLIDAKALQLMKSNAILVNTARGGLIDNRALSFSLKNKEIAAAGLDVFEREPLPDEHPLLQCENAILTSHIAWYSASSVPVLQRMATEEVVKALTGQPLKNRIV